MSQRLPGIRLVRYTRDFGIRQRRRVYPEPHDRRTFVIALALDGDRRPLRFALADIDIILVIQRVILIPDKRLPVKRNHRLRLKRLPGIGHIGNDRDIRRRQRLRIYLKFFFSSPRIIPDARNDSPGCSGIGIVLIGNCEVSISEQFRIIKCNCHIRRERLPGIRLLINRNDCLCGNVIHRSDYRNRPL